MEHHATPHAELARRLDCRQAEAQRQLHRFAIFARGRNVILGAIVLLVLLGEKERFGVKVALLALPAVLFEAAMRCRNRAGQGWRRASRAARHYEQRLACMEDRWAGLGRPGLQFRDETHPFAVDLDLFGHGCLFELLCTAQTPLGEKTLAGWLCAPAGGEDILARQGAVAELRSLLDLREELVLLASEVPAGADLFALASWGRSPPVLGAAASRLALVAGLLAFAALAGACLLGSGAALVLAVLLLVAVNLWLRRQAQQALQPIEALAPILTALARLVRHLEGCRFTSPRLQALQQALLAGGTPASGRLLRLARLARLCPLAVLLLARPLLAARIERWRSASGQHLASTLAAVGEVEALASLAAHSFENPQDPFPEIVVDGICFDAEALGHPLLPRDRCVVNDVHLAGDLRVLVVSGSNMSGKSTLLRTVGVNAVLALAGGAVRAGRLRISPLTLGATLRVQDSLQAGRSRFYAEVLRVRLLLDLARDRPLLFLLDELFAGTSSHDRRTGGEAVIRTLIDRGAIGLVTTHDLALTDMVEHLAPRASNVHFRDDDAGGAPEFDYRMRPGVVPSTNGLALMRAVGIEV